MSLRCRKFCKNVCFCSFFFVFVGFFFGLDLGLFFLSCFCEGFGLFGGFYWVDFLFFSVFGVDFGEAGFFAGEDFAELLDLFRFHDFAEVEPVLSLVVFHR